ncbi:MAG: hypothetical protein WCJ29_01475 [bacterium]
MHGLGTIIGMNEAAYARFMQAKKAGLMRELEGDDRSELRAVPENEKTQPRDHPKGKKRD